jgi:hypothetical protein
MQILDDVVDKLTYDRDLAGMPALAVSHPTPSLLTFLTENPRSGSGSPARNDKRNFVRRLVLAGGGDAT